MARIKLRRLLSLIVSTGMVTLPAVGCYQSTVHSSPTLINRVHQELLAKQDDSAKELEVGQSGTLKLALEDAIKLALKTNADIKIDRAALLMAEAGIRSATQLDNPQLRYSQERLESGFSDEPRIDVEFRVEPPRPGELSARKAIAETDRRVAEARFSMTKDRVASRIRSLFREISFVDEELKAANHSIAANLELVELANTRASMGIGTQVDVALATMSYEEVKQEATELRAEGDILRANLLRRLGLPPSTHLRLELGNLIEETLYQLPSEADLIELALKNRFELEVALARVQKAEAQAFIEGLKAWPRLSQIRVGYEMRLGQDFEGAVTGGLSLEVPLFNLNGGARDEANAREVLRKAELEEEVESVIVEVRKHYRQVQAAAEAVTTLQVGAKEAAQKATAAAKASMQAGQVDIRGLAEIESRASAVHRRWLKTLRRYHQEVTQLLEAVGVDQSKLSLRQAP